MSVYKFPRKYRSTVQNTSINMLIDTAAKRHFKMYRCADESSILRGAFLVYGRPGLKQHVYYSRMALQSGIHQGGP